MKLFVKRRNTHAVRRVKIQRKEKLNCMKIFTKSRFPVKSKIYDMWARGTEFYT